MACNLFMNGVDRFDRQCAAHKFEHLEIPVPMSIFCFLLDASIIDGYVLFGKVDDKPENMMCLDQCKHRVVAAVVIKFLAVMHESALLRRTLPLQRIQSSEVAQRFSDNNRAISDENVDDALYSGVAAVTSNTDGAQWNSAHVTTLRRYHASKMSPMQIV